MVELETQGAVGLLPENAKKPFGISSDVVLVALCAIGIGLRLVQWVWAPSQWLDEIALSRNILDNPLWQLLTQPLAYDQVAPKGFLLVSRLGAGLLGTSDYVLRTLPLIGAVVCSCVVGWVPVNDTRDRTVHAPVLGGRLSSADLGPCSCAGVAVAAHRRDLWSRGHIRSPYPFGSLYAALTLLGLVWFSWRSPRAAMFFVAPVVLSILAAALRQYPFQDRVVLFLMPVWFILNREPDDTHELLTMGSSYLAVVMAHLQRADALAHSFHGEALFISVDQDGLYGGLQIFLTNDHWILRDLIGNVGRFVAQPRVLAWVDVRLKHLKSDPLSLFGFCTLRQAGAEHAH